MKIYNHEINHLSELLFRLKLKGKESRMRTRLLKQFEDYQNNILASQQKELLEQYASYDENGEIMKTEDGEGVLLKQDTALEYHREYEIMMKEFFVVEENEANEEIIKTVANSLLNCDEEFSYHEATVFDIFCDRFEQAVGRYEVGKEEK